MKIFVDADACPVVRIVEDIAKKYKVPATLLCDTNHVLSSEYAKDLGFRVLQFNAVVESNIHARHLYERLGFVQLGTIPGGFRMKDGHYENICPYYHVL